ADDDGLARIAAGSSSDPRVRLLQELALAWNEADLVMAQWWLDRCDDRGYLEHPLDELLAEGAEACGCDRREMDVVRLRLLNGPWPGMAAADPGECLRAQLAQQPEGPERELAGRILADHLALLASHDHAGLAQALGTTAGQTAAA